MYDNTGYLFYAAMEEPTGTYQIAGVLEGDVKTDLKVGESTVITLTGDSYRFSIYRKYGNDWIFDDYAIKLEEISSVREPGSFFNYTARYRITAVEPGEARINVWHPAHHWLDWSMDFKVSDEIYTVPEETQDSTKAETPAIAPAAGSKEFPEDAGDANCDGKLTVADAVAVLQFIANKEKYPLSDEGQENADVDGVRGITGGDAIVIQKMDAGLF